MHKKYTQIIIAILHNKRWIISKSLTRPLLRKGTNIQIRHPKIHISTIVSSGAKATGSCLGGKKRTKNRDNTNTNQD